MQYRPAASFSLRHFDSLSEIQAIQTNPNVLPFWALEPDFNFSRIVKSIWKSLYFNLSPLSSTYFLQIGHLPLQTHKSVQVYVTIHNFCYSICIFYIVFSIYMLMLIYFHFYIETYRARTRKIKYVLMFIRGSTSLIEFKKLLFSG